MNNVCITIEEDAADADPRVGSWAAYNASMNPVQIIHSDVSVLLPLFCDPAHRPAMLCHGMTIITSAVGRVNQGQVTVLTVDQPLYSLAK